jgi:hypothetical protein
MMNNLDSDVILYTFISRLCAGPLGHKVVHTTVSMYVCVYIYIYIYIYKYIDARMEAEGSRAEKNKIMSNMHAIGGS